MNSYTQNQTLQISLLGNFHFSYGNQSIVRINTPRMRSLLAYLLLHRNASLSRRHIAFLFWPDSSESQARTNLRQLLHHLNRAFPRIRQFLQAGNKTMQWLAEAPCIFDVAEFEKAVSRAKEAEESGDESTRCAALERAVNIYRGDLLPECYQEWIEPHRDRLRRQFMEALEELILLLEKQREYKRAIGYAQRLLKTDDLRESSYGILMRLHAENNDRSAALGVYRSCAKTLRRELGVEPGTEIRELYLRLTEMPEQKFSGERKQALVSAAMNSLIGRQKEWQMLRDAWRVVRETTPQMIWITGEAGIGKTRLAEELLEWVNRQGGTVARTRFYAAEGNLTYAPVADWLRTPPFRSELHSLKDVWLKEVSRILPELKNDRPGLEDPEPLTAAWQRQQLFEALARAVLSARQPLLLFIDDLQWCDRETLEWLHYLIRFDQKAQLLVICSVRTELLNENLPLQSLMLDLQRSGYFNQIELTPLNMVESAALATQVARKELQKDVAEQLYRETEGNPLFITEMTRAGLENLQVAIEHPPQESPHSHLPPQMQAVIRYRLLQLSAQAQKLVELAATIGRDFSYRVLKNACEQDENRLVQSLDELCARRIIREKGADAYDFTHNKIREVAYTEISEGRRRLLHHRVAQSIETVHASRKDEISGQLAVHFQKADQLEKAIEYYRKAAAVSQRMYANAETIDYLLRGVALVPQIDDEQKKEQLEHSLLLTLAPRLVQAKGYGAQEVHATCDRVQVLREKLGESDHPQILRTSAIGKLVSGEIRAAETVGEKLLHHARQEGNAVVRVEAHYVLGVTYHWQGNFPKARHHLEQALQLCNPECHIIHVTEYAQEPSIICGIRLALVLWHLGYPYQAKVQAEKALALSEELNHPFSRSYALHWCSWLHNLRGDVEATQKDSRASMAFSRQYKFPYFATQSAVLHGWAIFEQNRDTDGLEQMRIGLARFRATGSQVGIPYYRGLLALSLARLGRSEQALNMLDEAITTTEERGENWPLSELYRLKGNILMIDKNTAALSRAEDALRRAIETGVRQNAKTFVLHAACDMKRLLEKQARKNEAHKTFDEIYRWVCTGLGTEDRKEIDALPKQWT